jgi:hypothetical protein
MTPHTFFIKSLFVQNGIMLLSLGVVFFLLLRALRKRNKKHSAVFLVWLFIILWFFNSPFFGYSAVTVGPGGIRLNYGILSLRNTVLPLDSDWAIETSFSGVKKTKRLYALRIGDRRSMKVRWKSGHDLLQEIGTTIDRMKSAPRVHERQGSLPIVDHRASFSLNARRDPVPLPTGPSKWGPRVIERAI